MTRKCIVFFSLLVISKTFCSGAGPDTWESANIYGGQIGAFAMQPSSHNVLLAGINTIYKSTDSAKTWKNEGVINYLITDIVFAPSNPDIAYVTTARELLYKSGDAGDTWSEMPLPKRFDEIACDPLNENIVYAGDLQSSPRKIYKSADGGTTWNVIYSLDADFTPSRLVVVSSSTIIVTANKNYDADGAIYRSTDAGATWTCLQNELDSSAAERPIYSFAVDPSSHNILYAGGRYYDAGSLKVFRSTDTGATWMVGPTPGTTGVRAVLLTVKNDGTLLAWNESRMYKSTDGGASFTLVGMSAFGNVTDPVYDDTNGFLYGVDPGGRGIYKSTDSATFTAANTGINGVVFGFLRRNPIERNIFYAGSSADLYRSTDTGHTWAMLAGLGGIRTGMGDVIVHPSTSNVVFMTQSSGNDQVICKSVDYGDNWSLLYTFPGNISVGLVLKLAFDPADPEIMYAGVGGGVMSPKSGDGLYKSVDGGQHWTQFAFPGSVISNVVLDPSDPQKMYVGKGTICNSKSASTTGAYRSVNGGATWEQMTGVPNDMISDLMIDTTAAGAIYATSSREVDRSTDSGTTWEKIASASGIYDLHKFTISASTEGQKALFYSTGSDIYMSIDDGETWTLFAYGFTGINLLFPGSLYAGTDSGLYKTDIKMTTVSQSAPSTMQRNTSSGGSIVVDIPAASFPENINMLLLPFTPPATGTAALLPTGVGIEVVAGKNLQPSKAVTLTFNYNNSDVTGLDELKLIIARYDDTAGVWIPLNSIPDPDNNRVVATTTHLSRFALAQYTAPAAVASVAVIAYPIPFDPVTQTQGMSIVNLAAGSRVSIFNILGQLIRKIDVPLSGTAVWDGRNDAGKMVASGIYIALVKDQAQKTKRLKLAVEK